MKLRLPVAVLSLFLPALSASAAATPATILIGGRVVPFQVKPYVGTDGQVMAPVDAVRLQGANYRSNSNGTVTITAASGQQFTTPYTLTNQRYCVQFQKVALALGGMTDWQPTTATLTVMRIGQIGVVDTGESLYIRGVGVLPDYRRRGYGRQLLAALLVQMRAEGHARFLLDVATENPAALSLCKTCGFREATIYDYHGLSL